MSDIKEISIPNAYNFDIDEARKSNVMICGQTGSGKSKLGFAIADLLINDPIRGGAGSGWTVYVFDVVGNWRESTIPRLIVVEPNQLNVLKIYGSTVFDISRLRISEQIGLVDQFSQWIWEDRLLSGDRGPCLVILEECQNYIKNLKSSIAENLFRLSMSGRNLGIRLCYISPRLNSVAPEFRFLAGQRYYGFADENNVLSAMRQVHGKDWANVMKILKVGEFLYFRAPNPLKLIKIPLFQAHTKPQIIEAITHKGPGIQEIIGYIIGAGVVSLILLPFLLLLSY